LVPASALGKLTIGKKHIPNSSGKIWFVTSMDGIKITSHALMMVKQRNKKKVFIINQITTWN
jgi:hypothetical protein